MCVLKPLISSKTTGEVVVVICKASLMDPASLFSLTPSLNLFFFWMGRFSERKVISYSGALPVSYKLIIAKATLLDSKG